jgi:hypothetical protein
LWHTEGFKSFSVLKGGFTILKQENILACIKHLGESAAFRTTLLQHMYTGTDSPLTSSYITFAKQIQHKLITLFLYMYAYAANYRWNVVVHVKKSLAFQFR